MAPAQTPELPPLDREGARALEDELKRDPAGLLETVRRSLQSPISEIELREAIAEARYATEHPREYAMALRGRRERRVAADVCPTPPDAPTDPAIPVEACSRRFETIGDLLGWVFQCGPYWLQQRLGTLDVATFRPHSAASPFIYAMKDQVGRPLGVNETGRVALFSDFGTGEYHSRYIAKHVAELEPAPHYAIHLGDVYYSGRPSEVEAHLETPLRPIAARSRTFVLNANHEMLSGGHGYFAYLDRKRGSPPGPVEQEQEGSYFCLRSDRYQIIGIDTAYDYKHDGEYRTEALKAWLTDRLRESTDVTPRRTNILLSQHEPFGLGKPEPNALLDQIAECARQRGEWLVDFWFWGDEHYCVLFEKRHDFPFVGSCIGHAGYPVDRREVQRAMAAPGPFAPAAWVDDSPRFDAFRPELGNAGFCLLELEPTRVVLTYRDWRNREQRHVPFPRA